MQFLIVFFWGVHGQSSEYYNNIYIYVRIMVPCDVAGISFTFQIEFVMIRHQDLTKLLTPTRLLVHFLRRHSSVGLH